MNSIRLTYNNKTVTIDGLPENQVRYWDKNIKIRYYHRGKRSIPRVTKTGKIKPPRTETQLYINGKYFLQFTWNLTEEHKETITNTIIYLYCYGCELDEIKRLLKKVFYHTETITS